MKLMRLLFLSCLVSLLCCGEALAAQSLTLHGFILEYGDKDEHPLDGKPVLDPSTSEYKDMRSTRNFDDTQKQQIGVAIGYWAERLKNTVPADTPRIYIGYAENHNGRGAFSTEPYHYLAFQTKVTPNGMIYDKYIHNGSGYPLGIVDNIIIFQNPVFNSEPARLLLNDNSMTGIMMHEMGHALGLKGSHDVSLVDFSFVGTFTAEKFTKWNEHLYDIFGTKAERDMKIENVYNNTTPNDPKVFQIFHYTNIAGDYKYPTFHGPNVDMLTGGKGMPVMGSYSGLDGANSLGHTGIMNSIMSYGIIRNMPFTEMELAAFNDMGYDIDLKQFFGKSYYYDVGGDTQVNTAPFGTVENPNTSIFGVGAHILRDNLNLTQASSIYAHGYGAGGVRIDGVGNTLIIPQGITLSADGDYGTGLLVSYGSNNVITLDGTVRATGLGGIGAHFGIKAKEEAPPLIKSHMPNLLGGIGEGLPGYPNLAFSQVKHELQKAHEDLDGPLVQTFAISGRLAGSLAAVKIENDAHVEKIAVRDGAVIAGDIFSAWARNTWGGPFATAITFGDPGSGGTMRMDGDITWDATTWNANTGTWESGKVFVPETVLEDWDMDPRVVWKEEKATNSLDVRQLGGHLSFNGNANVYSWQISPGATLGGNSSITIDSAGGPFLNEGTIAPGNSIGRITIVGDYHQSATGKLFMEFTPTATDQFIVKGNATIDPSASLSLQAAPAFYPTGLQRELTNPDLFGNSPNLAIASFNNNLDLAPAPSPTLTSSWSMAGANPVFNVTRASNAYSQYASGGTGASVGRALVGVAGQATGDMQNLFAAMDFSHPDGSGVRSALRQLAPTAYDNTAKSALQTGRVLTGFFLNQLMASSAPAPTSGIRGASAGSQELVHSAFVLPFAGYFGQDAQGDNQGFDTAFAGILGGVNRHFEKGLAGVHTALVHTATSTRSEASMRSLANSLHVGVHGSLYPHEGFFLHGLANAGLENTRMSRSVEIGDYHRTSRSEYTAVTAQSAVRAGYEWQAGNVRFGPVAGLDYGFYHRPSVSETGGQATRLHLEATNFHSLRSALGGQARVETRLADSLTLKAGLSAQWMHEVLDTRHGGTASFAGYGSHSFSVKNRTDDRDALALNASVALVTDGAFSLNAYAGTELFRKRSASAQGGLSFSWKF